MSIQNHTKINHLMSQWPSGTVMTSKWLSKQGYSAQLLQRYCLSGWIKPFGKGAYTKLAEAVDVYGAIFTLQTQTEHKPWLGGLSALEAQGYGHNISHKPRVHLYCNQKAILPQWFKSHFAEHLYFSKNLFGDLIETIKVDVERQVLQVACPEQAVLEMLAVVPKFVSFEEASNIVENLQTLRPRKMQLLLEKCTSIKAKKLFLYFADEHSLPCFKRLNLENISLGNGNRQVAGGGRYVAKYGLSVPSLSYSSHNKTSKAK